MALFAVCRVAEIPSSLVERFLTAAYYGANDLVPGTDPDLVVLPGVDMDRSSATEPASADKLPTSPFVGKSASEVAEILGSPGNSNFVVLDSHSAEDDTVLLVNRPRTGGGEDVGEVETVRATFASAQSVLTALEVGSLGFNELQSVAEAAPGGVYGRRTGAGPRKGGPAPRKRLGGD